MNPLVVAMWIDDSRLQTIREPRNARDAVDRLLADVIDEARASSEVPRVCPQCQHTLVVRTELGLALRTCPSGDGVWLSAADVSRLRGTMPRRVGPARFAVIALLVAALVALFVGRGAFFPSSAHQPKHVFDRAPVTPGGPGHFTQVPIKASAIDVHEELVYTVDVFARLEEGIDNRLAIDRALNRSLGDPAASFATFDARQRDFLARLRAMPVPARLARFHEHLVTATEHQIELYRVFAQRKAGEPSLDLRGMLRHPALVSTNRELLSAYALFKELYPALDQPTHDALYGRLCAFDII